MSSVEVGPRSLDFGAASDRGCVENVRLRIRERGGGLWVGGCGVWRVSDEWQRAEYIWGERRKVERSWTDGLERTDLGARSSGIVVNECETVLQPG